MDAVLRFLRLDDELVQVAHKKGWDINPTVRGGGHNVVLSSASTFGQQVEEVERFIRNEMSFLAEIQSRCDDSEIDFGIDWGEAHPVSNHRFTPRLLQLLAQLQITLNVSTYRS